MIQAKNMSGVATLKINQLVKKKKLLQLQEQGGPATLARFGLVVNQGCKQNLSTIGQPQRSWISKKERRDTSGHYILAATPTNLTAKKGCHRKKIVCLKNLEAEKFGSRNSLLAEVFWQNLMMKKNCPEENSN